MKNKYIPSLLTVFAITLLVLSLMTVVSCDTRTTEPKPKIETPQFSPEEGAYNYSVPVTITCATEDVNIFYTTDESEPGASSNIYTGPVLIDTTTVLKARAFRDKWQESDIRTVLYEIEYPADIDQVAVPEIEPDGGNFINMVLVTIEAKTEGAVIHYTLDESVPTLLSRLYTEPIVIDTTSVLKARGFKEGWIPSEIKESFFEIEYSEDPVQVATPMFDPQAGNFIDSVLVTITCATPNASIRYTLDGNDPTQTSTQYEEPLLLDETVVLKAKAFRQDMLPSEIRTGVYAVLHRVATPTFSIEPGEYDESVQVAIFCETAGADIYYTTDGSDPDPESFFYETPIIINETTTLKAKAFKDGWLTSNTVTGVYTIEIEMETVATPTFNPPEGQYTQPQQIEIICDTPDVQIRYTTSGIEPSENSNLYNNPININAMTTLRAKAFKQGWNPSETAVAAYDMKVATPSFQPPGGIYEETQIVTISSTTPDVQIHYTTDGEDPTFFSEIYTVPIEINRDTALKAKAFRSNWTPSDIGQADYVIDYPEVPDLIWIPAGSYMMGDAHGTGRPDARPVHRVNLTGFYIGQYQVTQKQWEQVMESNPSGFDGDDRPVDSVSWYWALIYCNLRSIAEELTPVYSILNSTNPDDWGEPPEMGYDRDWDNPIVNLNADGYRLPTEAEWEYAARGATNDPDYIYSGGDNADLVAWHSGNSRNTTQPVGEKNPNGLGIYDMSGNVWEWCHDWHDEDYYEESPDNDPTGPETGRFRIIRGGSWAHGVENCRVSNRMNGFPYRANNFMGLRVVRRP